MGNRNWLETIASLITAVATFIGVCYAVCQYCAYKEQEKTVILSKYNERYATDPDIQKVVNYLLWKENPQYIDDEKKKIDKTLYGGECEDDIKPTRNQVEMFMRFFEELQVSIDAGRLDGYMAKNLFAYYAKVLDSHYDNRLIPKENWLPKNYSLEVWPYFHKFIESKAYKQSNK